MSELPEPTERTADSYADVMDAFSIAFWDQDFEECESDALPMAKSDDEEWVNCHMREIRSFDGDRGCSVMVTHFKYSIQSDSATEVREYLKIIWGGDDEANLLLSLHELDLGEFVHDVETEEFEYMSIQPEQFQKKKEMAKAALGAVSWSV